MNGNQIINRYDATGRKLQTEYVTAPGNIVVPVSTTINTRSSIFTRHGTVYNSNKEYRFGNMGYLNLSRIHNPEGYLEYNTPDDGFEGDIQELNHYSYYRRDHLGNIREVWSAPYGPNESGLGICTMEPVPSSFFQEVSHAINLLRKPFEGCSYDYRQVVLTADSKIANYTNYNPNVWYDVVTEYQSGGKTIYQFDYEADECLGLLFHSIPVTSFNDFNRPLISCFKNLFKQGPKLTYKNIYKQEPSGVYKQVQEEETHYFKITGQTA
jgi:hypothetical protein